MKKIVIALFVVASTVVAGSAFAQVPIQARFRHTDFHSGVHSGSWTLKREQILEEESKDPYRSCRDPYCNRCSKHLADYGHEYQYISGPSQRQKWYGGTAGSIAPVTQRCYDEHGIPYCWRGQPGSVMAWEYQHYLNHAIKEQVCARNAVAAEEAAEQRVPILTNLHNMALARFADSEEAWKAIEQNGCCAGAVACLPCNASDSGAVAVVTGQCEYCRIRAQYLKDQAYLRIVEAELARATMDWRRKIAVADEAVRVALLSKEDADKATRFKRIQHKPPKYKEVLAAQEAAEARKQADRSNEPQLATP